MVKRQHPFLCPCPSTLPSSLVPQVYDAEQSGQFLQSQCGAGIVMGHLLGLTGNLLSN